MMWFVFGGSEVKVSVSNAADPGSIPGLGRSPGEGNGNPLSVLAWRVPWMEKPGRLQSTGLQRVRQDWVTSLSFHNLLRLQLTGVRWRGGIILLISYSGTQTNSAATIPTVDCHYARDLKNMQIELWILMLQLHYFHSSFISQNRSHGFA